MRESTSGCSTDAHPSTSNRSRSSSVRSSSSRDLKLVSRLAIGALGATILAGITSCAGSSGMNADASPSMRILALGDSYTIGESVDPSERWPVQLTALLRENGINVDEPRIIAKTGWTTGELDAAIDAENPKGTFDLVTLLIGVNNQYRGLDADDYARDFEALLQRSIALAGGHPDRVIVLSIPDWGVTPFAEGRDRAAIARDIDEFNRINREITNRHRAHYVDVTPISRRASVEPALVADDGLHPSGAMYREWAVLATREVRK